MSVKQRARELADYLYVVRQKLQEVDKDNPEISDFLSAQETYALLSLGFRESTTMSQLARALRLSLSSATALADKLEKNAYILRKRSQQDRRVVYVELTKEGLKFSELAGQARRKLALSILNALDPQEQAALLELVRKITTAFEQQSHQA